MRWAVQLGASASINATCQSCLGSKTRLSQVHFVMLPKATRCLQGSAWGNEEAKRGSGVPSSEQRAASATQRPVRGSQVTCDVGSSCCGRRRAFAFKTRWRCGPPLPFCLVRALFLDCLYSLCGRIAAPHSPPRLLQHPKITSATPIDAFAHLLYTTAHNVYPGPLRHCRRRGQRRGGR